MAALDSGQTPDDAGTPSTRPPKRKKTARACDYCRSHRIRCEYIRDGMCKHCEEYAITCEQVAAAPRDARKRTYSPSTTGEVPDSLYQGLEASYLGSSSISQLVWTYAANTHQTRRRLLAVDGKHDHIRHAFEAPNQGLLIGRDMLGPPAKFPHLSAQEAQARLVEQVGAESVLDTLIETARLRLIPLFPVISVSESLLDSPIRDIYPHFHVEYNSTPPTPLPSLARIVLCALPALSREVPKEIRCSLLNTLHALLAGSEVTRMLQTSSLANVQTLLAMSMSQDLHAQGATVAGSAIWQRTGAGIRMAFELALHRDISTAAIPFAQLNRRHRVWGACVIADRWLALQRGEALTIDLDDCDAPLPFPYPDHCSLGTDREPCFRFHQEVTKLSILLGRIYRLTCSPRGLDRADDLALYKFQADLDAWLAQIPSQWPYVNASPTHLEGIFVPEAASIMNLLIVAVEFTFLRGFLWPASRLPGHITFRPAPQRWPTLVDRALAAVAWLLTPQGAFYLDIWDMVIYPTTCCALVLLKTIQETHSFAAYSALCDLTSTLEIWQTRDDGENTRSDQLKIVELVKVIRDVIDPSDFSHGIEPAALAGPGGVEVPPELEFLLGYTPQPGVGM